MINVETGEITLSVTEDCRCRLAEVLTTSIKILAQKLASVSKSIDQEEKWIPKQQLSGSEYRIFTLRDIDGNFYKTIQIGNQVWMAENLRVTRYRNGDAISYITDNTEWVHTTNGAYCDYKDNNDIIINYGLLYNWYAVNDSRNIAPEGWRVPTDEDWKELELNLGISRSDADKDGWRGKDIAEGLKETKTSSKGAWISLLSNSTNLTGFSALPGGSRYIRSNGLIENIGKHASFWTNTELNEQYAWYRALYYTQSGIGRFGALKGNGFSVRLIRE